MVRQLAIAVFTLSMSCGDIASKKSIDNPQPDHQHSMDHKSSNHSVESGKSKEVAKTSGTGQKPQETNQTPSDPTLTLDLDGLVNEKVNINQQFKVKWSIDQDAKCKLFDRIKNIELSEDDQAIGEVEITATLEDMDLEIVCSKNQQILMRQSIVVQTIGEKNTATSNPFAIVQQLFDSGFNTRLYDTAILYDTQLAHAVCKQLGYDEAFNINNCYTSATESCKTGFTTPIDNYYIYLDPANGQMIETRYVDMPASVKANVWTGTLNCRKI